MTRTNRALITTIALFVALVVSPAVQAAEPTPAWLLNANAEPTNFAAGHPGNDFPNDNTYVVSALNIGGAATDGSAITLTANLPDGVTATQVEFYWTDLPFALHPVETDLGQFGFCSTAPVSCTLPSIPGFLPPSSPNSYLRMIVMSGS